MSWMIVGTTLATDESLLPRRLPPVFQGPGGRLVVALRGGDEVPASEDAHGFGDVSEEEVLRFHDQIAPRPGHLLLRVREGDDPELVALDHLDERARQLAWEALSECAKQLLRWSIEGAMARAWYAVRAAPDEPLTWLVVMALLRKQGAEEDAQLFADRVAHRVERLPSTLEDLLSKAPRARTALVQLLNSDPFAERWFDAMPQAGPRRRNALHEWRSALGP